MAILTMKAMTKIPTLKTMQILICLICMLRSYVSPFIMRCQKKKEYVT